jgi:hypothetical protein
MGKKYIKGLAAVAALVPSRNITRTAGRVGKWTEGEDIKLKDAVRTHGGKNWGKIAALVLSRTETQCSTRWHRVLDRSIDRANVRTGIWTEDDDIKLKDAVQIHGGKNWGAIASLVSCRTRSQCNQRWHRVLDPSIYRATGLTVHVTRQQSKTAS